MSEIALKLKKTNHLAIFLVVIIGLWQVYNIYEGLLTGQSMAQYICKKLIINVIPGVAASEPSGEISGFNKVFYFLTDLDNSHYKTFIERNIPLIKYISLLNNDEESQNLTNNKYFAKKEKTKTNKEDYFDPKDELAVVPFKDQTNMGSFITSKDLEDNPYELQKLINFDANLNYKNQAIDILDITKLINKNFKFTNLDGGPKVLIFHTHSTERFAGEEPGSKGVVDVGDYLKQILETQYGISVVHCTNSFDVVDKHTEITGSYERMEPVISKIIKENPSIELVIDIHRDGINSTDKFLTNIKGEPSAKLMFVNGFSMVQQKGVLTPITRLPNPYLEDNIALSLQLQLKANEVYPDLMRKTLVKPYRYSLHMKPMSLLIEVGNQNNTKEEALASMEPLAEILMDVIEKD